MSHWRYDIVAEWMTPEMQAHFSEEGAPLENETSCRILANAMQQKARQIRTDAFASAKQLAQQLAAMQRDISPATLREAKDAVLEFYDQLEIQREALATRERLLVKMKEAQGNAFPTAFENILNNQQGISASAKALWQEGWNFYEQHLKPLPELCYEIKAAYPDSFSFQEEKISPHAAGWRRLNSALEYDERTGGIAWDNPIKTPRAGRSKLPALQGNPSTPYARGFEGQGEPARFLNANKDTAETYGKQLAAKFTARTRRKQGNEPLPNANPWQHQCAYLGYFRTAPDAPAFSAATAIEQQLHALMHALADELAEMKHAREQSGMEVFNVAVQQWEKEGPALTLQEEMVREGFRLLNPEMSAKASAMLDGGMVSRNAVNYSGGGYANFSYDPAAEYGGEEQRSQSWIYVPPSTSGWATLSLAHELGHGMQGYERKNILHAPDYTAPVHFYELSAVACEHVPEYGAEAADILIPSPLHRQALQWHQREEWLTFSVSRLFELQLELALTHKAEEKSGNIGWGDAVECYDQLRKGLDEITYPDAAISSFKLKANLSQILNQSMPFSVGRYAFPLLLTEVAAAETSYATTLERLHNSAAHGFDQTWPEFCCRLLGEASKEAEIPAASAKAALRHTLEPQAIETIRTARAQSWQEMLEQAREIITPQQAEILDIRQPVDLASLYAVSASANTVNYSLPRAMQNNVMSNKSL